MIPFRLNDFPGYENQSVYFHDPGEIWDADNEDLVLFMVSFGGCAWPLFYVTPTSKYEVTPTSKYEMDGPYEQAVSNLLDTPEAEHFIIDPDDPDYKGQEDNLWHHTGWNDATDGKFFDRENIELVRELNEDETAFVRTFAFPKPKEEA